MCLGALRRPYWFTNVLDARLNRFLSNRHDDDEKVMDFWDHLEELRWVIAKSMGALALTTVLSFALTDLIFKLLLHPLRKLDKKVEIIYAGPLDGFLTQLKMALLAGVVLAAPFVVYFIWQFVAPGLKPRERRAVWVGGGAGLGFFGVGVLFAYKMLALVLPLLVSFGSDDFKQMWHFKVYIDFAFRLIIGIGLVFELPVVLVVLVRLGIVQLETLRKGRPYAVVIAFIVAAVLTPPDPFTQLMLGIPLVLLYEFSILAGSWQQRAATRVRRESAADGDAEPDEEYGEPTPLDEDDLENPGDGGASCSDTRN